MVVEDVHWAESAFLDLIGRVTDTAEDSPLLFVCAARPELTERHPGWLERPGSQVLQLELLSRDQTALVVENMLGEPTCIRRRADRSSPRRTATPSSPSNWCRC